MGETVIRVEDLTVGYGDSIVLRDLNFEVREGEIMVIMGGSGCGKSTLLKHMIGLMKPMKGRVLYWGKDLWSMGEAERFRVMKRIGVLYQGGALWSSMTLSENVALPLEEFTDLGTKDIREVVALKLALVGLSGFEDYYPSELSGGMRKRAALARAIALDPEVLFFDEPSAGLDPISAKRLDDLILELRDSLGATIVVVTHELASIFTLGDTSIFLDPEERTITGHGPPSELLRNPPNEKVREFLTRGASLPFLGQRPEVHGGTR